MNRRILLPSLSLAVVAVGVGAWYLFVESRGSVPGIVRFLEDRGYLIKNNPYPMEPGSLTLECGGRDKWVTAVIVPFYGSDKIKSIDIEAGDNGEADPLKSAAARELIAVYNKAFPSLPRFRGLKPCPDGWQGDGRLWPLARFTTDDGTVVLFQCSDLRPAGRVWYLMVFPDDGNGLYGPRLSS